MNIVKIIFSWFFGLLVGGFFLLMAVGFGASQYFSHLGAKPFTVSETMVEIPFGSSLKRVAEILAQANVIDHAKKFTWYLRLGRQDGAKIQAGYYLFSGDLSYQKLADRLLFGTDQSFRLTFKEGQTLSDLVKSLANLGLVNEQQFIEAMTHSDITQLINPVTSSRKLLLNDVGGIEGYLFPDTYFFSKKDTAMSIIKKMHMRLLVKLDLNIWQRIDDMKTTLNDVLTLASIIEKETGEKRERPIISSVYHNRLRMGMPLQADPTVIYGIKNYDGKIRTADLLTFHPYNTYKIKGLPPGPIASPGIESIRAALWPLETKYLYFVSKNDGSHVFCENLACHNRAVRKWQIDYFKNAGK